MAAAAAAVGGGEAKIQSFLSEVGAIERRDQVWTSEAQIERLLKAGARLLNLNPFEVLQVAPDIEATDLKKQYRKLSILVHPDKNQNDRDRADEAFNIVSRAYKDLGDEDKRRAIFDILEEAKFMTGEALRAKNKIFKAEGKAAIPENSAGHKEIFRVESCKLFAERDIRRQVLERQAAESRKREAEEQVQQKEAKKRKKEHEDAWEKGKESRIDSWRSFAQIGGDEEEKKKKKKKHKGIGFLRPPKLKTHVS